MLDFFNWLSSHPAELAAIAAAVWTAVQEIRHQVVKASQKKQG